MSRDNTARETDESTTGSLPEQRQAVVITDSESMLLRRARKSTGNDRVFIAVVITIFGILVTPLNMNPSNFFHDLVNARGVF